MKSMFADLVDLVDQMNLVCHLFHLDLMYLVDLVYLLDHQRQVDHQHLPDLVIHYCSHQHHLLHLYHQNLFLRQNCIELQI